MTKKERPEFKQIAVVSGKNCTIFVVSQLRNLVNKALVFVKTA